MGHMDALDMEIQAAARERAETEAALKRADDKLRALLVKGRAKGKGPSHMAALTGFTREWVAKIAPDPKAKQAAIERRLAALNDRDADAATNIAKSD